MQKEIEVGDYIVEIEVTNFNLRIRHKDAKPFDFEVSVNCVANDGENAIIKLLNPRIEFRPAHKSAMRKAIRYMGYVPKWFRAKRGKYMTDKTLPSKKEAFLPDGSVDPAVLEAHIGQVISHFKAGHSKVTGMGHYEGSQPSLSLPAGTTRHYFDVVHGEGVSVPA